EEIVPPAARLEEFRGSHVRIARGKRIQPLIESAQRLTEGALLRQRKNHRQRRPCPRRWCLVDGEALRFGDFPPLVPFRRMQPAAAEIDREGRSIRDGPCSAAQSRPRLDENSFDI